MGYVGGVAVGGLQPWNARRFDDYADMRAADSTWIRTDLGWMYLEPTQNTWRFDLFDPVVEDIQDNDMKMLAILHTVPDWANGGSGDYGMPTSDSLMQNYAYQTALHYLPMGVNHFEIGNEVNYPHPGWTPNGTDYSNHFLEPCVAGINQAATELGKTAFIIFGSLAPAEFVEGSVNPNTFLSDAYTAGATGVFHALAWHPYTGEYTPATSVNMGSMLTTLYNNMNSHGDGAKKIWGTEYGEPTGGPFSFTQAQQATHLVDGFNVWYGKSFTGPLFYYMSRDTGTSSSDREQHFGVLLNDGTPKLSYASLASVLEVEDMAIVATASGGTRNWSDTATWVGGVVPTAADDVQLDATSGNVTITSGAVCRSLDCTGYTGTLTHTSGVTLSIGDGTAGAGSVALKLVSGMTYTLGSASTSAISYISTSGTQQTITTGGKTLGNQTFSGAGSSYIFTDSHTLSSTATLTLTAGTLNTNNQTCSWGIFVGTSSTARTLTLGSSSISITSSTGWTVATSTNFTLNANTSTLTFTVQSTFNSGLNLSYNNVVFQGAGFSTITSSGGVGTGVYANLTRTGTANKADGLSINTGIVVSGTLTLNGNSNINRLIVLSNVSGSNRSITVNGSISASYVDFADIFATGSASWNLSGITGGSGDCGGNSGITFTSPTTQTWQGTSGGNWSDVTKWTSRIPLPQDSVVINSAFSASQTITMDMVRLGGDINWTGSTGNPTWALGALQSSMYGSVTLESGMTFSGSSPAPKLMGRGTHILTTNGVSIACALFIDNGFGSYTLGSALTSTNSITIGSSPHRGSLNTNGYTLTCTSMSVGTVGVSGTVLTLGGSTVNLTGTSTGAIFTVAAGMTLNAGLSNIVIANATANDRNIVAHGYTLGTLTYTVAGSTGKLILGISGATGTLNITNLNFSDANNARTLQLWANTTVAILGTFNVNGTSGKLMTINTSTGGTKATLSKPYNVVSIDYVAAQDLTATGSWYLGTHSTDSGNNTGLSFTDPPAILSSTKAAVIFF